MGAEQFPKFQFDREKYKAAVLYIAFRCHPDELGAVKYHKTLYFADMLNYIQHGQPITGSTYRKRPLGPTSDELLRTLRELETSGALRIEKVDYFGYWKQQYTPNGEPDVSRLNDDERFLLDEMIEFVCRGNSAKTISEFSHNRAWELADFGEVLPYYSAFHLLKSQVSPESFEWAEQEVKELEGQGQNITSLERGDAQAFRKGLREKVASAHPRR